MDPSYVHDVLLSFEDILSKLPPLSLQQESPVSLDALHYFLLSFASGEGKGETDAQIKARAVTSLVMLGIARG